MISIVLGAPRRLVLHEREAPRQPGTGEALVRLSRVGVCGTELHAFQGNQPFLTYSAVLGHELAANDDGMREFLTRTTHGQRAL